MWVIESLTGWIPITQGNVRRTLTVASNHGTTERDGAEAIEASCVACAAIAELSQKA